MKIKSVILENFRGYKEKVVIPFKNLTALIGKNDIGKSTILEALDIFFEGGTVKIDSNDGCKHGSANKVRIGVVFSDIPTSIILDSRAPSTLKAEYLLNHDGDFEIHKVYNCALAIPKASIFAIALHPSAPKVVGLIQKSRDELKEIVRQRGLEASVNLNENPSMRQAIYAAEDDLQLQPTEIPLSSDGNGKQIWSALQAYLPIFALFQSDRPSSDQDPEVQNPMKVAIEQALDSLTTTLEQVAAEVEAKAKETANRTLAILQARYPHITTALEPRFKKPNWKTIFKLDLEGEDGIPLNKRGSGIRRLILMSFFQAEAEKRRSEDSPNSYRKSVIYAVEEPETSQHPDSQEQVIKTLSDLAEAGDQVILTTHVPALAKWLPVDSLVFLQRDSASHSPKVRLGEEDVYEAIAEALGVYPEPAPSTEVDVAVLVEGKHDIDALRSMAQVLSGAGEITGFREDRIFWTIGGGSSLQDWVERKYLARLKLPQVIIRDSDRTSALLPVDPDLIEWLRKICAEPQCKGFVTNKRCMDNYIHPDAVKRCSSNTISLDGQSDLDFISMSLVFYTKMAAARDGGTLLLTATDHEGKSLSPNKKNPKAILNSFIMRNMTASELLERGVYTAADGSERNEIREWFEAILCHLPQPPKTTLLFARTI